MISLREGITIWIEGFHDASTDPNSPFLKAGLLFFSSFLEVPSASNKPTLADELIFDLFAVSLDPQESSLSLSEELTSELRQKRVQIVHFCLRNFFWHYVEKMANGSASAERYKLNPTLFRDMFRAVVNGIRFLMKLFTLPSFQSFEALSTLLPCLMAPFCHILKPETSKTVSILCTIQTLSFISQLFEQNPELLPEPPQNLNDLEITGSVLMRQERIV